jgi:LysR family transcriptional regulator, transcriptional activator for bauABCD operon
VLPARFNYACRFVSLLRRSPKPSRAVLAFQACLEKAHAR